ncbi:MAG TPA: hypothetical protein VMT19_03395 [Thermoanaerobaculaceae bacterium]|nr:hypothetical protein [Thermoanaerobaculaceae bacterium]
MRARILVVATAVGLLPALGEAKDLQVASSWAAAPVKVDGTAGAWSPLLKPLGDPPIVIGVQNDAQYLYLCVKTSDLKTKKQFGAVGLTVWANGEGKTQKTFGVRFPVRSGPHGMRPMGGQEGTPPEGEQPPPPSGGEAGERGVSQRPADFELIGPTEEDRLRVQPSADEPVEAALGDDSGVTVVEYRIPLQGTDLHPLAVGAAPGATIALGLETERPKVSRERGEGPDRPRGGEGGEDPSGGGTGGGYGGGRGGFGGGPGGMGGGYGGGHHGMGGGMREGARDMGSPMKLWLRVTLATPPAAAAATQPRTK